MSGKKICIYENFGMCKRKSECSFIHPTLVCEDDLCKITNCNKRHPQACKFMMYFGSCKFGLECKFDHNKMKKMEGIDQKIKSLEEVCNKLQKKCEEVVSECEGLRVENKGLKEKIGMLDLQLMKNEGDKKRKKDVGEDSQCKKNKLESTKISDIESMDEYESMAEESSIMRMDQDSLFEDMEYKEILIKEVKITSNLEKMLKEVKNNLKFKKIDETKITLRNIGQVVSKNETELKNVEQHHRDIDAEENNVLKTLDDIKNNIKSFEKLTRNKFKKVVESEINAILEDLSAIKVSKILNLQGIYDYSVQDEII